VSGSAFVATMRVPARGFRITHGTPKFYVKKADSGNDVTRAFCADCGSALYSLVSTHPERIGLRPTSLDDPSEFRSEADIFVKSAQPWDYMNPAIPRYDTYPPILTSLARDRGAAGAFGRNSALTSGYYVFANLAAPGVQRKTHHKLL